MTRRFRSFFALAVAVVILSTTAAARAAPPVAKVTGPSSVAPNATIWLKVSGSVSARPILVKTVKGPDRPDVTLLYDKSGVVQYAVIGLTQVTHDNPFTYGFAVVAYHDDKDAGVDDDVALWEVDVLGTNPSPTPIPPGPNPPGPTPPGPTPPPAPVPVTAKLFATAVFAPGDTSTAGIGFAPVRDDPNIGATLAGLNVVWHAWPLTDDRVKTILPWISDPTTPTLLVYDAAGNIYDATGNAVGKSTGKSFKAPTTVDATVAYFKKLRGNP